MREVIIYVIEAINLSLFCISLDSFHFVCVTIHFHFEFITTPFQNLA
jgi:hypothetical protein